jgi:large subunit ribosomal protein L1
MKHSKAYRKAAELVDPSRVYSPLEAANLAKQSSPTKFDGTVEVAMRLGVDPRKADQMVRGRAASSNSTRRSPRPTRWPRSAGSPASSDRAA